MIGLNDHDEPPKPCRFERNLWRLTSIVLLVLVFLIAYVASVSL